MQVKEIVRRTGVNRLRWRRKAADIVRYNENPREHLRYVLLDPELDNYTYELSNLYQLAAWLDSLYPDAGLYISELCGDDALRRVLAARFRWRPWVRFQPFGRRIGWYAIVRATKPALVVETGTHDGLGSVALLAALKRNLQEGHPGRLISIDPRDGTGWLVPQDLRQLLTQVRATSYAALPLCLGGAVPDLFIHDSLHTAACETWELESAMSLGAKAVLSDNAHVSLVLHDVAIARGYRYFYWQEQPDGHWYPGAGIGLAVRH